MTHHSPTEARQSVERSPSGPEPAPTPERPSDGHREPRAAHAAGTCSCGIAHNRPAEYDAPADTITNQQWNTAATAVDEAVRHTAWKSAFDIALSPNDHTSSDDLATVGMRQADTENARLTVERDQARDIAVELENQLAAVRDLHVDSYTARGVGRGTDTPPGYWTPYCEHDQQDWPCATIRALGGEAP